MIKRKKIFALIIPRFEDVFSSFFATQIIKGASIAASRNRIDILIHITEKKRPEDWYKNPSLKPPYVDGVIIADIDGYRKNLDMVIAKNIPYIVLNNYFNEAINCISIDNRKAAVDTVDYLYNLGHKDIATISGALNTQAGIARLEGYKQGLAKHKIKIKREFIKPGDFMRSSARSAMTEILKLKNKPTAVFAASDVMAMEAMDVIKNSGLSVPKDISIVGFDNNPLSIYSSVPLTTIQQPLAEMGRLGLESLNQIVRKKIKTPFKKVLSTKLIKRSSCYKLN